MSYMRGSFVAIWQMGKVRRKGGNPTRLNKSNTLFANRWVGIGALCMTSSVTVPEISVRRLCRQSTYYRSVTAILVSVTNHSILVLSFTFIARVLCILPALSTIGIRLFGHYATGHAVSIATIAIMLWQRKPILEDIVGALSTINIPNTRQPQSIRKRTSKVASRVTCLIACRIHVSRRSSVHVPIRTLIRPQRIDGAPSSRHIRIVPCPDVVAHVE